MALLDYQDSDGEFQEFERDGPNMIHAVPSSPAATNENEGRQSDGAQSDSSEEKDSGEEMDSDDVLESPTYYGQPRLNARPVDRRFHLQTKSQMG